MVDVPDLQFSSLGSFAAVRAETSFGERWLSENLDDDTMDVDGQILIDFRCLEDIVLGARADGLVCCG